MIDLFADRFVGGTTLGKPWLDLATGAEVQLRIASAGDRREQMAWNDRCGEVARLRHPAFNELLDFGAIGSSRTFEAYAIAPAMRTASALSPRLFRNAANAACVFGPSTPSIGAASWPAITNSR